MKRKVTNNDIRKAIRGVINEGHSSYMAKSQLYNIARKAQSMYDQLEKGEPLEDWMESNPVLAAVYTASIVVLSVGSGAPVAVAGSVPPPSADKKILWLL